MKLSEQYMVQEILDSYVMLPIGQNVVDNKSILLLNKTGFFIVNKLQNGIDYDKMIEAIQNEYEAASEEIPIIRMDLDRFLNQLRELGALKE